MHVDPNIYTSSWVSAHSLISFTELDPAKPHAPFLLLKRLLVRQELLAAQPNTRNCKNESLDLRRTMSYT